MKSNATVQTVQCDYRLHRTPPDILVRRDPYTFQVLLSGESFLLLGSNRLPVPGCPLSGELLWANLVHMSWRNRQRIFTALVVALALAVFQAAVCFLRIKRAALLEKPTTIAQTPAASHQYPESDSGK